MKVIIAALSFFFASCSYRNYAVCHSCKIVNKRDIYNACGHKLIFSSKNKKVFSPITGRVTKTGEILGSKFLLIEKDSIRFVLTGFKKIEVEPDSIVNKGTYIGTFVCDSLSPKPILTLTMACNNSIVHPFNTKRYLLEKTFVKKLVIKWHSGCE